MISLLSRRRLMISRIPRSSQDFAGVSKSFGGTVAVDDVSLG